MSKPFQFSIRRMLAATALWCASVGLFCAGIDAQKMGSNPIAAFIIVFGSGAFVGCGFGILARRPLIYAALGGVVGIVASIAVALWYISTGTIPP
jgi:hypothetical protein